jgi:peptidoglycan/LPS O-acetylase OafA/YrhL
MAQETSSSLRKKILKIDWKEYLKKRWLYFLGFIFIYVIPLIVVIEKLVKIKNDPLNNTDISFSFFGFILGIVYIVFISKKIKTKINDMKIGFLKTLLVGISNIIPFATVGFLAHLISNGLSGFNITIWAICGSMLIGSSLQALDFFLNKDFLYDLELKKIAVEKVLAEKKEQDIRDEIAELNSLGD